MPAPFRISCFATVIFLGSAAFVRPSLAEEPKWQSLIASVDAERNAVAGKWERRDDALHVDAAQGARLILPVTPQGEYDFRVTFTRHTGMHSIALIFLQGEGQATFEVDAWGEHLAGIQNIAGKPIRENGTRRADMALKNGKKYTMTVEVRKGEVRGLLDGEVVATHRSDGSDLSMPNVWAVPQRRNLGLGVWDSETTIHRIEARSISGTPLQVAQTNTATPQAPATPKPSSTTKSAASNASAMPKSNAMPKTKSTSKSDTVARSPAGARKSNPSASKAAGGKRVLLVIANYNFFYREYAEPRRELEQAGIRVTVAAGQKAPCRPHTGSGQGPDGGVVQPDIAIADARADDYDAILFSGGWGASAYQYAFDGRYNDPAYNGNPAVKAAVNRLINAFVQQDKYVCALCNAVSVLAWSRVDGKSLLSGKRVCASARQAPPGIYNGRPAQPSCRWHPEANGAVMSPPGSIGRPGTAEDDVLVDGKVVTGEDDIAAREMGRRIVQLLSGD